MITALLSDYVSAISSEEECPNALVDGEDSSDEECPHELVDDKDDPVKPNHVPCVDDDDSDEDSGEFVRQFNHMYPDGGSGLRGRKLQDESEKTTNLNELPSEETENC